MLRIPASRNTSERRIGHIHAVAAVSEPAGQNSIPGEPNYHHADQLLEGHPPAEDVQTQCLSSDLTSIQYRFGGHHPAKPDSPRRAPVAIREKVPKLHKYTDVVQIFLHKRYFHEMLRLPAEQAVQAILPILQVLLLLDLPEGEATAREVPERP